MKQASSNDSTTIRLRNVSAWLFCLIQQLHLACTQKTFSFEQVFFADVFGSCNQQDTEWKDSRIKGGLGGCDGEGGQKGAAGLRA